MPALPDPNMPWKNFLICCWTGGRGGFGTYMPKPARPASAMAAFASWRSVKKGLSASGPFSEISLISVLLTDSSLGAFEAVDGAFEGGWDGVRAGTGASAFVGRGGGISELGSLRDVGAVGAVGAVGVAGAAEGFVRKAASSPALGFVAFVLCAETWPATNPSIRITTRKRTGAYGGIP